jgi:hypothetical protein
MSPHNQQKLKFQGRTAWPTRRTFPEILGDSILKPKPSSSTADGDVGLPVKDGKWVKEIAMGKNHIKYDSMLVLTHFKGHTTGGLPRVHCPSSASPRSGTSKKTPVNTLREWKKDM